MLLMLLSTPGDFSLLLYRSVKCPGVYTLYNYTFFLSSYFYTYDAWPFPTAILSFTVCTL